jgi:succinate-semialdehyde dehydrogenase/glutarate-semialdehyde dehydrogenase
MAIASINPATGETLRTFDALTNDAVDRRIAAAATAFEKYRRSPFSERSGFLRRAADILEAEKSALARLMALEMGKPVVAGEAEGAKCALVCRYYADHGEEFLRDEEFATSAARSYVRYLPLGAVLAVMPWNFPFWQVFRFAAPALMAGNVGLLKHSSNVPQCALAIEDVFRKAGVPEGVFQTLLIESGAVERIIRDPRVKAVTLTGSEPAGRAVGRAAGDEIKKVVLELGGSDPFIVMPSANLDEAVKAAVKARAVNSGQSCIAAKRFIVHEAIAPEFERRFVAGMSALRVGDPLDPETEVGPLATPQILNEIDAQVAKSVEQGAVVLTGGKPSGKGNFYPPTVLVSVPPDAPAAVEETFGPVAAVFRVHDAAEAVRVANATAFGLGASAWTNDSRERGLFIDDIESGQVFINAMVASDPRVPFGGVKRSGFGRELGPHGIREFVNVKTIWIQESSPDTRKVE